MTRQLSRLGFWVLGALWSLALFGAESPAQPIRAGIIGLDAHALTWTRILNDPQARGELADLVVVAAYPGGSPDIPQSMELLGQSVAPIRQLNVDIVNSIDQLVQRVDAVMILSIDGRVHLAQARPVFAAGKPVFIDKPLAASVAEAAALFRLARESKTPCFSSSALRFAPGTQAVLADPRVGPICGCDAFSPCPLEPHHPDLFWYGIHGVETLFTIMGTGCQSVTRIHTDTDDVAVGVWKDGRIGTFRGTRQGPHTYGATVFGTNEVVPAGRFEGYEPLLAQIVTFFKTGRPPVSPEETLEILAFMEAADESQRQGGASVRIDLPTQTSAASSTAPQGTD
ncbi:MAG: dehydrogenase [Planctomycetes bacterium RBG_16_64_10]|nr:MAG: dehydrogenase [Planctomycetes bacterium RBG_16_64_10]